MWVSHGKLSLSNKQCRKMFYPKNSIACYLFFNLHSWVHASDEEWWKYIWSPHHFISTPPDLFLIIKTFKWLHMLQTMQRQILSRNSFTCSFFFPVKGHSWIHSSYNEWWNKFTSLTISYLHQTCIWWQKHSSDFHMLQIMRRQLFIQGILLYVLSFVLLKGIRGFIIQTIEWWK